MIHIGVTEKELNTLIAACMITGVIYEERSKGKNPQIDVTKELAVKEAHEYQQLESKLRIYHSQLNIQG